MMSIRLWRKSAVVGLLLFAGIQVVACGSETTGPPVDIDVPTAEVNVVPAGASISGIGSTHVFSIEARDSSGSLITSPTVTWTSLNPNIATIDEGGSAAAVENGQVTIAAQVGEVVGYGLLTVSVPLVPTVQSWSEAATSIGWMNGVWGTSPNDVFAVGDSGTILHYDGMSWNSMASGTIGDLYAVWGTASNDVFAVGDGWQVLWSTARVGAGSGQQVTKTPVLCGVHPRVMFSRSATGE